MLLQWSNITAVGINKHSFPYFLSEGLQINHNKKGVPEKIIVYLENNTKAKELIEQHLTTASINQ